VKRPKKLDVELGRHYLATCGRLRELNGIETTARM
jgi:hypothetical protein